MMYRGLRPLTMGLLLCLGSGVEAALFTITTTQDASLSGECSLRDAFHAINYQEERNACPAGTGNDTVRLTPGAVYVLAEELSLGGVTLQIPRLDEDGEPVLENGQPVIDERKVNPRVYLQLDPAQEDDDEPANAIIEAGHEQRVFRIHESAHLALTRIDLRDGDVRNLAEPYGGLVYNEGTLVMQYGILQNGQAASGGAVYLAKSGSFSGGNLQIIGNAAVLQGGAVATADDFAGTFGLSHFYMAANSSGAEGGAALVQGKHANIGLFNGTLRGNTAGAGGIALHVEELETSLSLDLNNLTIADNSGPAGTAAVYLAAASDKDLLANSAVVGNAAADCAGDGFDDLLLRHTVTGASCPPSPPEYTAFRNIQNGVNLSNAADISVLRNSDGPCVAGSPCEPIILDEPDALPGYLPEFAIPENAGVPSLFDTGSPITATQYVCEGNDQRGHNRADRCDIGAFEFQRSEGQVDSFEAVSGVDLELDVVANDLGDSGIDCRRVTNGPCLQVVIPSTRNGITIEEVIDADGYPKLLYRFAARFDGIDYFEYLVHKDAFVGATFGDADVGARVAVIARPGSGMTGSRDISDFGGISGFLLGTLVAAGLWRRLPRWRLLSGVALLSAAGMAGAAEITVSTTEDHMPPLNQAGQCTLREAIHSGIDKQPNLSGCINGQTGQDLIKLPEGTITLVAPLEIGAANGLAIEGEGVDKTIIEGTGAWRLLSTDSNLVLRNLTLRLGNAGADNGGAILARANLTLENVVLEQHQAANGGAVFLAFNRDESSTARFRNVFFRDNVATADGGAIGTFAQTQRRDIEVLGSTFAGNSAGSRGGAIDANLRSGTLWVINSTFIDNTAATGGAALDLADVATSVSIINSTFLDNPGASGQIDLGAELPQQSGSRTMANSIYAGATTGCSSGDRRFDRSKFNLFASADVTCEATGANNDEGNSTGVPLADIRAALNGGVLLMAAAGEDYFLPHVPLTDPHFSDILDAGNPAAQVNGTGNTDACRETDLRGEPRTSGEQCDRGAYELQLTTAVEDVAANENRRTRTVLLDVLYNDVAGDGYRFRPGTLSLSRVENDADLPDTLGEAFVRLRKRHPEDEMIQGYDDIAGVSREGVEFEYSVTDIDDPTLFCGVGLNTDGSANRGPDPQHLDDDCVIVYRLDTVSGQPSQVQCDALPLEDHFRYSIEAEDFSLDADDEIQWEGTRTAVTGLVKVTIRNVPPRAPAEPVTRRIEPGSQVTIDLRALGLMDADGEVVSLTLPSSGRPNFAARDPYTRQVEGVGVIFDQAALTVTYVHADNTKHFTDRFIVRAEDDCGDTTDIPVQITFPQQSNGGGPLSSAGGAAAPWWLFGALLLLGRRRR
ncbi:choice-of-anchor Q domain-containing protein [Alcanivorax quisquiliarum]|uniref:CSLREA domain-containing protein n=1 Tax=Alcanivorax quisquiliarum TaxID=2933565 RepID=A0ABT0E6W3_9GAMM|nr:choice-of-anchor Q domain-containing protein [Alcanivorax quisquiliarum]MCK0537564.1 hypothetical protein [Alcanivorax quisquiliarum]